jgi:AAA domain
MPADWINPEDVEARRKIFQKEEGKKLNGGGPLHEDDANAYLAPIDPTTLHGLPVPERRWLVPDWIPMARASSLYGDGGEGKTLLAQMLATACALDGAKWLGLTVRRCNSLLVFCEDDLDEMFRRQIIGTTVAPLAISAPCGGCHGSATTTR